MKAIVLTLGVALASVMATTSVAQSKGEVDPEQSRAAPAKRVSKDEKAAARKERISTGKDVSKTATGADDSPNGMGRAKAATADERKTAKAKRKTETAEAVKKGQIPSGER